MRASADRSSSATETRPISTREIPGEDSVALVSYRRSEPRAGSTLSFCVIHRRGSIGGVDLNFLAFREKPMVEVFSVNRRCIHIKEVSSAGDAFEKGHRGTFASGDKSAHEIEAILVGGN